MGIVGRLDQYASMLAGEFDDYSMSENLRTNSNVGGFFSVLGSYSFNGVSTDISAPDGSSRTYKVVANGTQQSTIDIAYLQITLNAGVTYTVSVYYYATGSTTSSRNIGIQLFGNGSANTTFTLPQNTWVRQSLTFTASSTSSTGQIRVISNDFGTFNSQVGATVYLWGAQVEQGSVATDYTPTTTTAVTRVLPSTTNTNITGLSTYFSSGFSENVGAATTLAANVFPPYDLVYDDFGGTLFGAGQGRYMRQNTDKSVIVYNEIDEVSDFYSRGVVRAGLVLDLDAGVPSSYPGTGTTWTDLSVYGNNGTLTNGPTFSSSNGGVIVFDGTDDYVNTSYTQPLSDFTVICWFKKLDSIYWSPIFGSEVWNNGSGYVFYFSTSNSLHIVKGGTAVPEITANPSAFGVISNFNCYVVTVNSSGSASIFVNGSNAATANITLATQIQKPVIIGCRYSNDGLGIADKRNIQISNFSFYNRALTAAEVKQNYDATKGRFGL
jgi:hypothetical protein